MKGKRRGVEAGERTLDGVNLYKPEGKDTPGKLDSGKEPSSNTRSGDVEEGGDLEDHLGEDTRSVSIRRRLESAATTHVADIVKEREPRVLVLLDVESLLES
jgi:hypothetical protein